MVETPAMLVRTLVAPPFITSCTALRNCPPPSPMVILPLRSRMVTSPTCRLFTSISSVPSSNRLIAGAAAAPGEPFAQRHQGAAAGAGAIGDVVHEASHVDSAAAVRPQDVFGHGLIADLRGI